MKTILFSLLALFTLGCTTNDDDFEPQTITPVLIGKGHLDYNTFYTKQNIVITSNNEWQTLLNNFNSVNNNITATFIETNVDFNNYQIIVAIDNKNSTTSVDITKIIENSNNIAVTVQNLQVGVTQDVANPFHIIRISKNTKPIVFE